MPSIKVPGAVHHGGGRDYSDTYPYRDDGTPMTPASGCPRCNGAVLQRPGTARYCFACGWEGSEVTHFDGMADGVTEGPESLQDATDEVARPGIAAVARRASEKRHAAKLLTLQADRAELARLEEAHRGAATFTHADANRITSLRRSIRNTERVLDGLPMLGRNA